MSRITEKKTNTVICRYKSGIGRIIINDYASYNSLSFQTINLLTQAVKNFNKDKFCSRKRNIWWWKANAEEDLRNEKTIN